MSSANYLPFQNLTTPTFEYQIKYQTSGQRLYLPSGGRNKLQGFSLQKSLYRDPKRFVSLIDALSNNIVIEESTLIDSVKFQKVFI